MKPHVDLFSLVYLKTLKTPKRHFEINGPLVIENFATKKIKLEYLRRLNLLWLKNSKHHDRAIRPTAEC